MKDQEKKWANLNTSSCDIRIATLPEEYMTSLKEECDAILASDERIPYDDHLVGEIVKGDQIMLKSVTSGELKYTSPAIVELSKMIMEAGRDYLINFLKTPGIPESMKPKPHAIQLTDLWLNRYMAGDYNPVHHHMKQIESGLSFFLWLEFPIEEIAKHHAAQKLKKDHRKGDVDGHTVLMWRSNSHNDCLKQFTYPGYVNLSPSSGTFLIFPSWLTHLVYPFPCDGRRVSIAGNIEVIWAERAKSMDPVI